ncbi:MAG: TlpA family protein disulfide reductase [Lachnospiraceae bacterium]|nr:TlpA family protein disulfide reductase [Lachnospiraceae bacterium]
MKKILIMLLLMGALFTGCTQNKENIEQEEISQETETEQKPYILNFEAVTTEGDMLTSDCFADSKLTMLNVWATYCGPCLNEMPELGEIVNAYDKSEFQMLGIISDVYEDAEESTVQSAKDLIIETKADYLHVLLSDSLYESLVSGVTSVPTTFFVNQNGEVLGYVVGAQSKESWEEIIHELLEKEQ